MVKVVEIVAVSESVWDGNEGVREVSLREREREGGRSGGGVQVSLPARQTFAFSVPLGRHVSAPPD